MHPIGLLGPARPRASLARRVPFGRSKRKTRAARSSLSSARTSRIHGPFLACWSRLYGCGHDRANTLVPWICWEIMRVRRRNSVAPGRIHCCSGKPIQRTVRLPAAMIAVSSRRSSGGNPTASPTSPGGGGMQRKSPTSRLRRSGKMLRPTPSQISRTVAPREWHGNLSHTRARCGTTTKINCSGGGRRAACEA